MDKDLEKYLDTLNLNELNQLCIILKIKCNGSRTDIYKKININNTFDSVYRIISVATKHKYIIECNGVYPHIYYGDELLSNNIQINKNYMVINDKKCDICNNICVLHLYENMFHIADKSDRLLIKTRGIKNDENCYQYCVLL